MKKLKLLLSICALCLSFSVLCIGIYAAQSVTYTISGTISYTVEDVFATISAKVFKVSGQQDVDTMQTNVNTLSTTALSSIASTTYIDAGITIADFDTASSSSTSRNIDITIDNTYMTYYIVINIENIADRAINAQLTDTTAYTNLNTADKLIQNNIAKDETKNLVVAFSLAEKTVGIDSLEINYQVEIGYNAYTPIKLQDSGSYWYTELGQVSDSDATKLKWRYVGDYSTSTDGTETFTCYDYTNTYPKIGCGSVFVQETALGTFNYVCEDSYNLPISNGVLNAWKCGYSIGDETKLNYFGSYLREGVRSGGLFNLTRKEVEILKDGFIEARTLPNLDWSCYNWDDYWFEFPYKNRHHSHEALSDTQSLNDYFWLMSVDEACLYFDDQLKSSSSDEFQYCHTKIEWNPDGSTCGFWLRNPCCDDNEGNYDRVTVVTDSGYFTYCELYGEHAVRATFRLG